MAFQMLSNQSYHWNRLICGEIYVNIENQKFIFPLVSCL